MKATKRFALLLSLSMVLCCLLAATATAAEGPALHHLGSTTATTITLHFDGRIEDVFDLEKLTIIEKADEVGEEETIVPMKVSKVLYPGIGTSVVISVHGIFEILTTYEVTYEDVTLEFQRMPGSPGNFGPLAGPQMLDDDIWVGED